MSIIIGILIALCVCFVVVMIHEFGHFIAARMTGMRVLEFGLGIPPKVKKVFTDKKGTDFTLNWLPIGGFVRIDGEDIKSPDAFKNGAFMSKKLPARLLVLSAGVIMNIILAWAIFVGLFMSGVRPLAPIPFDIGATNSYFLPSYNEALDSGFIKNSWVVVYPLTGSIAEDSWLQSGDVVLSANNLPIISSEDLISEISKNEKLSLEIMRNDENKILEITPEDGKIGTAINQRFAINQDFERKMWFIDASIAGAKEAYFSSILTFKLVKNTFAKLLFPKNSAEREEATQNLSGPIGAGNAVVNMVTHSVPVSMFLIFTALLSINLAVMNILPFPALDGGRIVFTTLYSIAHRIGIPKQKFLIFEGWINTFGFLILLLFMLYVAGLDIFRLF